MNTVKERPILFSAEMVKAILEGRKTQTRRVMKPQPCYQDGIYDRLECGFYNPAITDREGELYPGAETFGAYTDDGEWGLPCPYGQVGDKLWVRETHYRFGYWAKNGFTKTGKQKWTFKPSKESPGLDGVRYCENSPSYVHPNRDRNLIGWFKRPSIFMPRWASRITLEITNIRIERVQDITKNNAINQVKAEGVDFMPPYCVGVFGYNAFSTFMMYWDSLNANRGYSWDSNPWVWVIEFKRVNS